PSEPVPFQLVPPPERWLPDVLSVAAGAVQSIQALTGALQPNSLVNNNVSTLAAPQTDPPPVTQSVLAGDNKPAVEEEKDKSAVEEKNKPAVEEEKKTEPAADKPITGTGPNKVEPATKAKTGWRPGDLLRQLFAPKPTPATEPQGTKPSTDPTAPAATHETTGNAESAPAA
ncbi:MAG TPA: hypothetical protein VMS92_08415, partial [Mycobacterium sp.]|nr:hypothetical protein [Mycobacterium sp.]